MDYGRFAFTCVFEESAVLPLYKGSTLRGIFGHALKKVVCALKKENCADCLLADRCIYPTVFEIPEKTSQTAGRKRIAQPPHPYVIEPSLTDQTKYQKGEALEFTILLFGAACHSLPYFIYAFEQVGKTGIGKSSDGRKGTFTLQEVRAENNLIYSKTDKKIRKEQQATDLVLLLPEQMPETGYSDIELELVTPLRLKYQNDLKADLPFDVLTRAMLRRISSLGEYHGEGEPKLDYRGLVARARDIVVRESHIGWHDWRRYSNRQEQAMLMGGIVGKITYENVPGEYLPLLRFCEKTHLGKQTTFGLGKIKVTQM